MIRIGFNKKAKLEIVETYRIKHKIKHVIVFYPEIFPLQIAGAEKIEYKEIIMYRTFYPLLEKIDNDTLLVFNECMRVQNRSELTYNCAHHYCNQTPHKIVFETFPFIDRKQDFMILLDLLDKGKYKGKSFSWGYLQKHDIMCKPLKIAVAQKTIETTDKEDQKYQRKKKYLFEGLKENQDPDIIPRNLHVFAGGFKKPHIDPEQTYVARNARFKLPNVTTYKNISRGENYIIIDFPHRRIDFCDFLKISEQSGIIFLSSGLPVDQYYYGEFMGWAQRLEVFYAKASLC